MAHTYIFFLKLLLPASPISAPQLHHDSISLRYISSNARTEPLTMADALAHLNTGRTRIEWLAQLRPGYKPAKAYRRTSIIGTIGEI